MVRFGGYALWSRRVVAQAHRVAVEARYNSTRVDRWAVSYMVAYAAAIHNSIDWVATSAVAQVSF